VFAYIVRRVLSTVPVMAVVALFVFALLHLSPGDPAAIIAGATATPADIARIRIALVLHQPLYLQFGDWVGHLLRADLGVSIFTNLPVSTLIGQRVEPTVALTISTLFVSVLAAIPMGVLAAWKQHSRFDQGFMLLVLLGVSIPSFWTGLNLIAVFAVALRLLPVAGYVSPSHGVGPWAASLLLPAIALAFTQAGLIARMARDSTIEVLGEDYIRTARGKGAGEAAVLTRHAFRNALIPTVTVVGTSLANLLSGAVVIETVFVLPGVGNLVVQSISRRDYPVIEGVVLFVALVYVLVNLLVDLLYAAIDPRIRY